MIVLKSFNPFRPGDPRTKDEQQLDYTNRGHGFQKVVIYRLFLLLITDEFGCVFSDGIERK